MAPLSAVQCPILVGRDHVLDLADEVLLEAAAGRGRTLLLAGEAGIGKTRIMGAIARKATAAGFEYQQSNVAPADIDVPLGSLSDLFRTMREDAHRVALADELLARYERAVSEGGTYSRKLVLDLVEGLRASINGPTFVVFEDLQWADDMSLEAIGELARRAATMPLVIIATYRRDENPPGTPLRDWRARLLTQRLAEEVRLERLTPEQTGVMATLLLDTGLPAPRTLVDAIHARSDGLPLHVEELIAAARSTGEVDETAITATDVPDSIEDAMLARVARRSTEAVAVAQAGAVMGRCFAPSVLAQVMDRSEAELDVALGELVDHGILFTFGTVDEGYYDFRHQLMRETLYRRTPDRTRREYHARAGEFGRALIGASEVHASVHYEEAGLREEAYRAALAGASEASRLSAHREAFELYRRAYRNMPDDLDDLERGSLLERYAREAAAIEENALAMQLAGLANDAYRAAERPGKAIGAIGLTQALMRRMGRPLSERRAPLVDIEAEATALEPGPERAELLMLVGFLQLAAQVDAVELEAARATVADLTERTNKFADLPDWAFDVGLRAAMADVLAGDPGGGLATMTRLAAEARDGHMEEAGVTAFRDTAIFAVRAMDYPAAEAALTEGLTYAASIQQSHCGHIMAALVAETDWAAGRWSAAIPAGEQAIADRGCRRAPAIASVALGYVALGQGEEERAAALLEDALRFGDASEMIEHRLPPMWGFAELALLSGRPAAAVERCEAAYGLCVATGERALLAPWIVTGVRAYQTAKRPGDAERWLARCAAHLAATPAFGRAALDHGAGLVAMAAGATAAARTSLEAAVSGWAETGRGWEHAWAQLDLAACHVRASKYAAAVALASEVRETATRLGSPALLERADELLRNARGRVVADEPWRPLTAREFEVARLIAEGYTNPEIADALSISPKTASSHVEHILAKLGVSRRAEIATWATTVEAGTGHPRA